MDVVGLYPHIPHEEGLKYMKEVIEEYIRNSETDENFNIGADDLIDLAKFILENNYFEFEGNIYRQKLRTAIGTEYAPSFANMFMHKYKSKLLRKYHLSP